MTTLKSDPPELIDDLNRTVREINTCICGPRDEDLTETAWHHAKATGIASVLLFDHDNGLDSRDGWEHLRFHLVALKCPQCHLPTAICGYDREHDVCPLRERYEAER